MPAKNKTKPKPTTQSFEEPKEVNKKDLIRNIITKKPKEKFLNDNQRIYHDLLKKNQITICSGPAGVGKSFMAIKTAIELLTDPTSPYEKLLIVRPAVEADERLGSLPGNLEEKLDPYVFPTFYLLHKIIGKDATEKLKFHNIIEVHALAFMRGLNIDNSILVFEESQNSTPSQMKLLLTRIGFNSKFFISGDLEQNDRYKDKRQTGLWDAMQKFKDVDDIGIFSFTDSDIVRNSIISKILKKYEE
jgi:phosphate starvation-inducible PhoH-like protein